jgi:RNA 2',3'-cyclic 3'-phosphodiesterase
VKAPGERRPRKLRLFFALWPSDSERTALAAASAPAIARVEGDPVSPNHLHVTLAFLGMVPGQTFAHVVEIGGQGPWPLVELEFDRIEFWARPRVLVALPAAVPAAGRAVVDGLWERLEELGFTREARPWQPHMTLARRVRRPPPENLALTAVERAGGATAWRLALVESVSHPDGTRYRPLADWALGAGGRSPR